MDGPPAVEEPSTPSSSTASVHSTASKVWGVCLVAFDHAVGPTIEYSYPPELSLNEELNKNLPFLALPDGAHTREEDYSYFHLLLPSVASGTVFGISCNRQIQSDELVNKGKDVTRSTVQKAIVVLASKPMFGPLRDKLGVVTRAFFAQKDFDDKGILVDLYSSLELSSEPASGVEEDEDEEESGMYMGTSLRELVYKFRFKTLMLLKLLMLQRKVMFYGTTSPVESLCTFQYSLVALIPALLTHLEDAAAPSLDERSQNTTRPTSLKTSDKSSLLRYLGLPLNIFGKDAFFQPYLPLQQIDLLQARSFLVGTTNSIFQQQRDSPIDVIIDTASLEIHDPRLSALLTLTAADRKWMDEIVTTVENSWNAADPSRPLGLNFVGSDDFLRAKFEEYICSLLACIKFGDFLVKGTDGNVLLSSNDIDTSTIASFNEGFINAFKATPAFELWDRTTDSVIFDLVEPRHPMEGKTNAIEDVGIRLAHGLHDLNLDESLAPARDAIARGLTSSSDSIWKTYTSLRTDFTARRTERQSSLTGTSSGHEAAPPLLATSVLAGVDVAKTNAAHLASGIGSFLSSKRSQLLGATSTRPSLSSSDTYNHSSSGGRSFDRSDPPSPTTPSSPSAFSSFFKPYTLSPPPSTTSPSLPSFFTSFVRKSFSDGPHNEERSSPGANQADRDELEEELGPVRDLDLEWAQREAMLERMRVKEEKRVREQEERREEEGEKVWEEAPGEKEEVEKEEEQPGEKEEGEGEDVVSN